MTPLLFAVALAASAPAAAPAAPSCDDRAAATARAPAGDRAAREGAQRGLDFLARAAKQWQDQHRCYGCHVQAVTLEAMTVGLSHQYRVADEGLNSVLAGMLDVSGGQRGPNGFSVGGDPSHLIDTSTAFGGSALAHYDERVSPKLKAELVATAEKLLRFQDPDGSVRSSEQRHPVAAGRMQSTTQALVTWRQAQARTADTRWLVPIRKAEEWLTREAKRMSDERPQNLQDVAHAVLGLSAAGRGSGDKLVAALARVIERAQNADGGWGFFPKEGSVPYMTGQALYTLRLAGRSDDASSVRRGTKWLLDRQRTDGSWSDGGFGKAEAMWAVLGLVSMDLLSVDVAGIEDGRRVEGRVALRARASDNSGRKVKRVALYVDDVKREVACGPELTAVLDADRLADGPHIVDVVAENDQGKQSRRRLVVYAGEAWLTELGTRYDQGKTHVGVRSLATEAMGGRLVLRVLEAKGQGAPAKGREVARLEQPLVEGPASFAWDGAGASGDRFFAELSLIDRAGKVRDVEEVLFTHDTLQAQRAKFAEVAGAIALEGGDASANTEVELVDDEGRVVQRTTTTRSGSYRFQNVDGGKYKVRVKKQGFRAWEADVDAKAAAETAAPAASMVAH